MNPLRMDAIQIVRRLPLRVPLHLRDAELPPGQYMHRSQVMRGSILPTPTAAHSKWNLSGMEEGN